MTTGSQEPPRRVPVWDIPTRIFHWLLLILVVVSVYTGKVGGLSEMSLHLRSGVAILVLILFRLVWGVVGSHHSRFGSFVASPLAAWRHLRALRSKQAAAEIGHNPAGAWMVLALLAVLLGLAASGLFADDDIFTKGPLAHMVSTSTSKYLTWIHYWLGLGLLYLIGLHVAAILIYTWVFKDSLVPPMINGSKITDNGTAPAPPFVPWWRALLVLAGVAGLVYGLLTLA